MTHTPAPWNVHPNYSMTICAGEDSDGDACIISICQSRSISTPSVYSYPKYSIQEANAQHIVKCVNMHDELLEALEVARDYFVKLGAVFEQNNKDDQPITVQDDTLDDLFDLFIELAPPAIAKARGENET